MVSEPATTMAGITTPSPRSAEASPARRPHTTLKAMATASVCLGLWGFVTFWVYPFGLAIGAVGATLGAICVTLGIRAGNEGQHLAWVGLFLGSCAVGAALTVYRGYQFLFEGTIPFRPWF